MDKRKYVKNSIYFLLVIIVLSLILWAFYVATAPFREIRDGAPLYPESGAGSNL